MSMNPINKENKTPSEVIGQKDAMVIPFVNTIHSLNRCCKTGLSVKSRLFDEHTKTMDKVLRSKKTVDYILKNIKDRKQDLHIMLAELKEAKNDMDFAVIELESLCNGYDVLVAELEQHHLK